MKKHMTDICKAALLRILITRLKHLRPDLLDLFKARP